MIDKKIMIEGLEKRIASYEKLKNNTTDQDLIITINFTIRELENIIDSIKWGMNDVK